MKGESDTKVARQRSLLRKGCAKPRVSFMDHGASGPGDQETYWDLLTQDMLFQCCFCLLMVNPMSPAPSTDPFKQKRRPPMSPSKLRYFARRRFALQEPETLIFPRNVFCTQKWKPKHPKQNHHPEVKNPEVKKNRHNHPRSESQRGGV